METTTEQAQTTELWQLDAVQLAARLRAGDVSAEETVVAHLARIEAVDPALNAVCWRRFDSAIDEARLADRRRAAGEPLGPLHGVPVTIKECLGLAGSPATFGLESRRGDSADADTDAVRRLRAAGAIVVAKTNVAQLLAFVETDNPVYGRTDNPWDRSRTPGGSSGGQAALLAAGGVPLGLGTDIGGSLRIPSAFCGTAALKPTAGRHPDPGLGSFSVGQQGIVSQVGPMARSVADLHLAMRVLDGAEHAPPLGDPGRVELAGLRIGVVTGDGLLAPAPAVRRAVQEAADALAARGAQVVPWTPPALDEAVGLFYGILGADGVRHFKRLLGAGKRSAQLVDMERGGSAPLWLRPLIAAGLRASGRGRLSSMVAEFHARDAYGYWGLVERMVQYRARFAAALDRAGPGPLDALVLPAFPVPAMRHGASAELGLGGAYTLLANLLGYPAGVVPVTRVRSGEESLGRGTADRMDRTAAASEVGSAGLPVGVQVVARPWRDHVALAVMAAVEAAARTGVDFPVTPIAPAS